MFIKEDIKYIGVIDTQIDLFEGQYSVPEGISYNSYAIIDEKIAITDTVDAKFGKAWLDNIKNALGERNPDFLIVHHMEPDHSANILAFCSSFPNAKIVASAKAFSMIEGFFGINFQDRRIIVSDGDMLELGKHTLHFITAPMVHWPEVIMSYDTTDGVLFSADAFGKFGNSMTTDSWVDEARRYYIGIVGKYGTQVRAVLKKASGIDISTICPLHGPVITSNIDYYVNLYDIWSSYSPEDDGIVICYTSVYGNTKNAVLALSESLVAMGKAVVIYDLARSDMSRAVADAFRYSKLVLATTTYNNDIFPYMRDFISHLTERGYKNRTVGFIENGSWAPAATKTMRYLLESCKDITYTEVNVTIKSALKNDSKEALNALASELAK